MQDDTRPPLPKYAKYLPEYEPIAQQPIMSPRWGPALKMASITLGLLCVNTTIYLIASLALAPHTSYGDESVGAAEIMWVLFGLLPGLSALICWGIYTSGKSAQR
jgi:hypothetical protein